MTKRFTRSIVAALFVAAGPVAAPALIAPAAAEEAGEGVLAEGSWTKKSFAASGTWSIVERSDGRFVVLSADFKTQGAPDLKLFLSPLEPQALNGKNATDGSVLIAPLSSNKGAQEYELPEGVDLAAFKSIIIHCEAYSKLWSVSAL